MEVLGSKYIVERKLGGGGMAEVYLGRTVGAEGFSRAVAIKRVIAGHADNPQFVQMFVAEAQISARLQHPNIVSVLDFDRDDEGRPFLVMEHVEGTSLQELVDSGPLPVEVIAHVTAEVLRGLGYAHQLPVQVDNVRGVVHRDVSPHNVLLSWEGAVKVSDFGIAKIRAASEVTASEMLKGKPAYMSPEQANGDRLDGRSDLFAVGIMLWQMLCGRTLFAGNTTQETLARLLFAPIPSPRDLRDDIPDELIAITMKLLARDREERYPNAAAAIADLLACDCYPRTGASLLSAVLQERFAGAPMRDEIVKRDEIPTAATPRNVERLPGPLDAATVSQRRARGSDRRRRLVLAIAAGVVLVGGAVAIYAVTRESEPRPVAAGPSAPAIVDAHVALAVDAVAAPPVIVDAAIATSELVDAAIVAADLPIDAGAGRARPPKLRDAGVVIASAPDAAPPSRPAPPEEKDKQPADDPVPTAAADLFDKIIEGQRAGKPYSIAVLQPTSFDPYAFHARALALAKTALGPSVRTDTVHWSGFDASGRIDTTRFKADYTFAATQPKSEYCILSVEVRSGRATLMIARGETCKPGWDRAPRCTAAQVYARMKERGMSDDPSAKTIAFTTSRSSWQVSRGDFSEMFGNDCQ